ncbi:hypothetical protein BH10BAC2_BH10BAC2_35270 [soil metagenome]
MKKRLSIILLIIAGLSALKPNLAIAQWNLAGNTLTGTEKLGSINNFPIRFYTNNTQRMTLSALGKLGIGTVAPEAYLHILRGSAGAIVADANSTLIVESSLDNFISLLAPSTKKSAILFGSTLSVQDGGIIYNGPDNTRGFQFNTNGNVTRMVLTSAGSLGIGTKLPKAKLHIFNGSSGAISPNANSPLVVESNGDNFINVLAPNGNKSGILFGDNLNPQDAGVIYNNPLTPDGFQFNTNGNVTRMVLTNAGRLGIGTNNPAYALSVNGTIQSKEVRVETGWSDYVFEKDYKLRTLDNVAKYIEQNKHLPGIPSAEEIRKNGLAVGEVQTKMMEKIEELTLYVIKLNEEIQQLKNQHK